MFLIFIPIVMAMTGIFIAFLGFIGVCMIVMGVTGIAMNKICFNKIKMERGASRPIFNIASLILGTLFVLFPSGYLAFKIIFALSSK